MGNIKLLDVYLDNNIGDDLMLKMFLNHFKHYTFYIVNSNPFVKATFMENQNLVFLNDITDINYKDITHYITIGGSVFNNTVNTKGKIIRTKRLLFLKKLKRNNTKIFTIGSNLGPFVDKLGEKIVQKELNLHDIITVRDRESYEFIDNRNKFCFDDIVSCLNGMEYKDLNIISKGNIGISIHNNKNEGINLKVIDKLVNYIKYSIDNNKKVILFNFDIFNENDSKISNLIKESLSDLQKKNVEIVSYTGTNLIQFLQIYFSCSKIIGFRFHSLILSSLKSQDYIGFSYSNKMIDYAKTRGYTNVYDISDISTEILMDESNFSKNKHEGSDGYKHFEILQEWL